MDMIFLIGIIVFSAFLVIGVGIMWYKGQFKKADAAKPLQLRGLVSTKM